MVIIQGGSVEYRKTKGRQGRSMMSVLYKLVSRRKGSVLIISTFVIALVSALVIGILQINMSEIRLTQHRVYASQALALAEAGLNAALAQIRWDRNWTDGFQDEILAGEEKFGGGDYDVDVNSDNLTISAAVTSWQGYTSTIEAQITVSDGNSPYIIRIDNMKVNE
jgi:Tfp pilus assembly protein PilX